MNDLVVEQAYEVRNRTANLVLHQTEMIEQSNTTQEFAGWRVVGVCNPIVSDKRMDPATSTLLHCRR